MRPTNLITLILALGAATLLSPSLASAQPSAATSLVRVNVTSQSYNFLRPWEKQAPSTRRGLGAVLEGDKVITTAELVANATYLELEMPDTGEKVTADIAGIDYEANLAVLAPDADATDFLASRVPLEIASEATVGDTLEIWQIEDNGTPIATSVKIIKVDIGPYFLDSSYFLTYEVYGALQSRSGSFTLPAVKDGKLAGLLLGYSSDDQVSDVLASPIISRFLEELKKDEYPGFPHLGINYAQTLDEQLRGYAGLDDYDGGVYVTKVVKGSSADDAGLEVGDVLLKLGDHDVDSRGNYDHPLYGKINLSHIVRGGASTGDIIPIEILRDGKPLTLEATLKHKKPEEYLVDPYMFNRGPKFLIEGGLIFQELSLPYLKSWGGKWRTQAPFKLMYINANQEEFEENGRDKVVFLSQVLRSPSTLGYERLSHLLVTKVNDQEINNIRDLDNALKSPIDGIHKIEFDSYPRMIFVDAEEAAAVNQQLLQLGIPELKRLD
ncbi:MAG: PDZ domain-containing protein [Verrucomicrobiota bacterium]